MISAHSESGKPPMPVPIAGNAMVRKPFFGGDAQRMRRRTPQRPRGGLPAQLHAGRVDHVARLELAARGDRRAAQRDRRRSRCTRCWIASPPLRRITPARPPPSCRSLFAALTMASTSISVRSPCSKTILSAKLMGQDHIRRSTNLALGAQAQSAPVRTPGPGALRPWCQPHSPRARQPRNSWRSVWSQMSQSGKRFSSSPSFRK